MLWLIQSPVRKGEILQELDVIDNWFTELKKEIFKDKIADPFHYPDTFLLLLGYSKTYLHLPIQTNRKGIPQGHSKGA